MTFAIKAKKSPTISLYKTVSQYSNGTKTFEKKASLATPLILLLLGHHHTKQSAAPNQSHAHPFNISHPSKLT